MSRFPCVEAFLTAVYELLPCERADALKEVADFHKGYVECREEEWRERLAVPGEIGAGSGKGMPS